MLVRIFTHSYCVAMLTQWPTSTCENGGMNLECSAQPTYGIHGLVAYADAQLRNNEVGLSITLWAHRVCEGLYSEAAWDSGGGVLDFMGSVGVC